MMWKTCLIEYVDVNMPGIDLDGFFSVLLVATVKREYDLAKLDIRSREHSVLTLSLPLWPAHEKSQSIEYKYDNIH